MTKLMQWLCFGILFISIWLSFVTKKVKLPIAEQYPTIVLFFPVICVFLFGVYAIIIVLWRVYNFNDCEDAAIELKKQILEARADLKAKGFKFKTEET